MVFKINNCCPILEGITATSCISCREKALLPDPVFPSNPSLRTWYLGTIVHFQFLVILTSLFAVLPFRNKIEINRQVSQYALVPV